MSDPFILKALFSTFIIAAAFALLIHSRRSKLADKASKHPGEKPDA